LRRRPIHCKKKLRIKSNPDKGNYFKQSRNDNNVEVKNRCSSKKVFKILKSRKYKDLITGDPSDLKYSKLSKEKSENTEYRYNNLNYAEITSSEEKNILDAESKDITQNDNLESKYTNSIVNYSNDVNKNPKNYNNHVFLDQFQIIKNNDNNNFYNNICNSSPNSPLVSMEKSEIKQSLNEVYTESIKSFQNNEQKHMKDYELQNNANLGTSYFNNFVFSTNLLRLLFSQSILTQYNFLNNVFSLIEKFRNNQK
jgi:hypothetical protein